MQKWDDEEEWNKFWIEFWREQREQETKWKQWREEYNKRWCEYHILKKVGIKISVHAILPFYRIKWRIQDWYDRRHSDYSYPRLYR